MRDSQVALSVYTNTREMEIYSLEIEPILPGRETPAASESFCCRRYGMEIEVLDYMYVKVSRICSIVFLVLIWAYRSV